MTHISPDLIRLHREMEAEGERVTPTYDPIVNVEQLLSQGATARVLRLTPDQWRAMSPAQQRNLIDHTEKRIKALAEKLCFMRRHEPPELQVPEFLRVRGAG